MVRINVLDSDDLPPRFTYQECEPVVNGVCLNPRYTTTAVTGQTGALNVQPARIRAVDGDTLNYTIK